MHKPLRNIIAPVCGLLFSVACGGTGEPIGPGCAELGSSPSAQKAEAVIRAAGRFSTESAALSTALEASCRRMATDLGLTIPSAGEDELQVEVTCRALAGEIDDIATSELGGATITIVAEPPRCYVDANAELDCVAECDASFSAMSTVRCEGGEVQGRCDATCSGTCYLEGELTCAGECRGSCTGTCSGDCNGACDGTCSVTDEAGNCIGTCEGTCMGTCSGQCTGTCSGTCVADIEGACTGTCEGMCSVEFVEPRCTGGTDIMADADCEATCRADARLEAECTEPVVSVVAAGVLPGSRAANLVSTLQRNWPAFVATRARLEGAISAGATFVSAASDLAGNVGTVGAQAAACLTVATADLTSAVGEMSASVSVSVEVSASITTTAR